MSIFATAGSKVFIGTVLPPQNADFVAADFEDVDWTEISNLESIGTFGDTASEITFDDIGKARTQKLKGTRNAGSMDIVMGIDYADAGQIALLAAEKTPFDYAIKVEFADKPAGVSAKNSQRLFTAKVMSVGEALDAANNVAKLNCSLGINSNIVKIAASAS